MDNKLNRLQKVEGMLSFYYQNYRVVNDDDLIRDEIVLLFDEINLDSSLSNLEVDFNQDLINLYRNLIRFGDTGIYKFNDVAKTICKMIKDDTQRASAFTNTELLLLIKAIA